MRAVIYVILLFLCVQGLSAQQNKELQVRRIPAAGIEIPAVDAAEIRVGLEQLAASITILKQCKDQFTVDLLPDVLVYYKAVAYPLQFNEFFNVKEFAQAKVLLKEGQQRAAALLEGKAPWATATGEVVRGYISKIDGSVQPYGLSIPSNYTRTAGTFNLSLWFHGRNENLSELSFIANGKGFLPVMPAMKNTIMLYPYGRYCNGFKFAGETDILEALQAVKKHYAINNDGIFNRGFSMGGAAVWQMAVHYPDWWLGANPGAGFAETREFLLLDKEVLRPSWYEEKLLHLYDCTEYASNLANLPIVAYNGDEDLQKQAADVMERAMAKEGLTLPRVRGLKTKHAYEPSAAKTVDSMLERISIKGKNPAPKTLHFTTYTLKYNEMYWLGVDALGAHWARARVDASADAQTMVLKTTNVTALSLKLSRLPEVIDRNKPLKIIIDGKVFHLEKTNTDAILRYHQVRGEWIRGIAEERLTKKHDLQGPMDDAFMSAFIIVKPTGESKNPLFDQWSKAELERFIVQWRRQFRGEPVVKNDVDITADDLSANLIAFGDEQSNQFINRVKNKLPLKWDSRRIQVGDSTYDSKDHALILICPNPLNIARYLVLNSGFTFREESFLNNAKQVAMLPDWAVVDLTTPPGPVSPGRIVTAGFFDEQWTFKPSAGSIR